MNDEVRIVRRNGRKTEKSINAHAQLERPFVPRRRETRKLINTRCRFATMALCKKVQEIHLLLTNFYELDTLENFSFVSKQISFEYSYEDYFRKFAGSRLV